MASPQKQEQIESKIVSRRFSAKMTNSHRVRMAYRNISQFIRY